MAGLLYKDFVSIKSKKLIITVIILTIILTILRLLFPGTEELDGFMITNDNGDTANMIDTFFFFGEFYIIWGGMFFMITTCARIIEFDEKSKLRGYLSAMPFEKKTYVASKYVFMGIIAYAVFSLYMIWHIIIVSNMGKNFNADFSNMILCFSIPFMCLILFIISFDLPMFLLIGKQKTLMVRISIALIIVMIVFWMLLFGDLDKFSGIDIEKIMNWIDGHAFELVLISVLSPIITIAEYYLSYRIAAYLYERREADHD